MAMTLVRREAVKAVQMDLAARLLRLGVDVALEFGFFSRAERDEATADGKAGWSRGAVDLS